MDCPGRFEKTGKARVAASAEGGGLRQDLGVAGSGQSRKHGVSRKTGDIPLQSLRVPGCTHQCGKPCAQRPQGARFRKGRQTECRRQLHQKETQVLEHRFGPD